MVGARCVCQVPQHPCGCGDKKGDVKVHVACTVSILCVMLTAEE